MQTYEKLLERGMKQVPKAQKGGERFQMPRARVLNQGMKTFIANFLEIAQALRREPGHLMKFFLKELATSGEIKGKSAEFTGRFLAPLIDRKIELYVKNHILCQECGKPDTKIIKKDNFEFIKCEACGARHPAKGI
jgi:translation initiation factor 2 subunit 2